jgi:hypothetical protein
MIHQIDLIEHSEQMQEDIMCIMDGIQDDDCVTMVCQVIVDHINVLLAKGRE